MLASLRKKLLILGAGLFLALPVAVPVVSVSAADIEGNLACGTVDLEVPNASKNCKTQLSGGTSRINKIITQAINIFSIIVGIVAVIMIIVGGFKYITSGGDSGNISSAKNTIIYAVIGLVIVALAQFLVQFVLDKASQ
jgi:hypothetical protein